MTETLVNMHHHRIKYQWQAKQAEEFGVPADVARSSAPDIQVKESVLPQTTSQSPQPDGASQSPRADTGAPPPDVRATPPKST